MMKKKKEMKNKGLIATIIILSGVIVMLLVILLLIKLPSISLVKNIKTNATEKNVESTTWQTESIEEKEETIEEIIETVSIEKGLTTNIISYNGYKDNVKIDYPEVVGMKDVALQEIVNQKIKTNALSIVPLYPISTALQKLNISCEVKSLDEDYITILYVGDVVGKNASQSYNNVKNTKDPYLNGFVDPLAINNAQAIITYEQYQQVASTDANINDLPLPKVEVIRENDANIIAEGAVQVYADGHASTADKGPTVKEITSPTAKAKKTYVDTNIATNNPSPNAQNSTGVVYSGRSNFSPTPLDSDNRNGEENGPGVGGNLTGVPVYAYASSNTSASTINQKIFYTNTINLKTGMDVTLKDYVDDIEALAKYTRSSKVEFVNIDAKNRTAVRNYINKTVLPTLISQLKEADFRNTELRIWPKNFSYRDADGTVYFSVRLSSKLGNYAIVKYKK